jgi:hypothetical protein
VLVGSLTGVIVGFAHGLQYKDGTHAGLSLWRCPVAPPKKPVVQVPRPQAHA